MCIAILSTAHPAYALILLNNRDEVFTRPTARASFWPAPDGHILSGRDMQREAHGTWLGITKAGRLALLTNFREEGESFKTSARSRGEIPKMYMTMSAPAGTGEGGVPVEFAKQLVSQKEDDKGPFRGVGGFSFIFGLLRKKATRLAVISNRTKHAGEMDWLFDERKAQANGSSGSGSSHGCACALSNSNYGDRNWPKVVSGEELLQQAIADHVDKTESEEQLLQRCFSILSTDTLPRRDPNQAWAEYTHQMRKSIFIPPVGGEDKAERKAKDFYGTHKQTVILVGREGNVTFIERTLFDDHGDSVPVDDQDRKYHFTIENWEE